MVKIASHIAYTQILECRLDIPDVIMSLLILASNVGWTFLLLLINPPAGRLISGRQPGPRVGGPLPLEGD